jgi:hypothetical protein
MILNGMLTCDEVGVVFKIVWKISNSLVKNHIGIESEEYLMIPGGRKMFSTDTRSDEESSRIKRNSG